MRKYENRRPITRPRHRRENFIHGSIGYEDVDWTVLAQSCEHGS
jgi:hypothetical protein